MTRRSESATRCALLALLCVAGANAGCASADDMDQMIVDVEDEQSRQITWEEYRSHAIPTAGGGFVAEGDLMFENEAALRGHYEDMASLEEVEKLVVIRQLSTGMEPTFTPTEQVNLTYCVSNSFNGLKSTIISDVAAAIKDWEAVARLKFVYLSTQDGTCTESNTNVQFAVMPFHANNLFGCGANKKMWPGVLPSWGCQLTDTSPGLRGVLLLDYSMALPAPWTRVGVLRHELGHILGFRHEHPWASPPLCEDQTSPTYDLGGRQLTPYDATSVMAYPWCGGSDALTLTPSDGVGTRAIYGMPASWHVSLGFPFAVE